ncbi:hypothetical protein BG011_009444 [Mortierella polycephala]|uniref:TLC domain-containing protein n=1 Tax=Mortierella polycephala TaxID=41804 RepID=A0A9P6PL94_9FUNG|nr:hypothetical protein BG011_009444 [Mortierella polycephala]
MDSEHPQRNPTGDILEALKIMTGISPASSRLRNPSFQLRGFDSSTSPYGTFLGFEKNPESILFGQTIVISFFLQFVLFFMTKRIFPSLNKNRKGLSWILTFFSAVAVFSLSIWELGYMRTSLWSLLGWESSETDGSGSVFSYWAPSFHAWVHHLTNESVSTEKSPLDLLAQFLCWFISLPIFSLAPLKPTHLFSPTAPYYLGGGGRLIFSLENFPRETWFSSVVGGYFVGYCFGDLSIGSIYYLEQIDIASGWIHHGVYTWLVTRCAQHNQSSSFLFGGGPMEISTIFLASGYMFPHLRGDFWFPLSFFITRIVYLVMIWHEFMFNFPVTPGGCSIYSAAFVMHVFWFSKYIQGRRRRARRDKTQALEQLKAANGTITITKTTTAITTTTKKSVVNGKVVLEKDVDPSAHSTSISSARSGTSFQLRAKK